jgi:S-phase kinase-associated protein 1
MTRNRSTVISDLLDGTSSTARPCSAQLLAGQDPIEEVLPLPNVTSAVLRKAMEFCQKHRDAPVDLPEGRPRGPAGRETAWVKAWLDEMSQEMLFELILAANYLEIKPLKCVPGVASQASGAELRWLHRDVCCGRVAAMIKGKSPEEIRTMFNIVNNATPEEEARQEEVSPNNDAHQDAPLVEEAT